LGIFENLKEEISLTSKVFSIDPNQKPTVLFENPMNPKLDPVDFSKFYQTL
jgi:hypothetical protein